MERTYFDPFGEKVGEDGEVISPLLGVVKLGFTSHRHDDDLGLINMRGRIFDPVQKRFLTPDPYVPAPLSGQSYNRFAYVFNNPMRYTDPSGFSPPAGDLKTKGGTTEPTMGAAPEPVPLWRAVLNHVVIVVTAKADDTGEPPPKVSREEQERKWGDFFKKMSWGAAKQLFWSNPEVTKNVKKLRRDQQISTAIGQAWDGDWDLAASTTLGIVEEEILDDAGALASIVTGPIEAALDIPEGVQTARDPDADPEERGAAAVKTAQEIVIVAAAVVGAARSLKGAAKTTTPYKRPAGATTPAQRAHVQGKPCVDCGAITSKQVADHKTPLVKEHYGTGTIDMNRMRSIDAVQPQCPTCSARQGADMSRFSRQEKARHGL